MSTLKAELEKKIEALKKELAAEKDISAQFIAINHDLKNEITVLKLKLETGGKNYALLD